MGFLEEEAVKVSLVRSCKCALLSRESSCYPRRPHNALCCPLTHVQTYTHALEEIDAGRLWKDRAAPELAVQYWGLQPGASMRGELAGA